MVNKTTEMELLEGIAKNYRDLGSPFEHAVRRSAVRLISPYLPPSSSILELGCSDGYMTSLLQTLADRHVVVDASSDFIQQAKGRVEDKVSFVQALFEEYEPPQKFDLVVMSFILEHIEEPSILIKKARTWLTPGTGRIFALVPNIRALSRQLGRVLGFLTELNDITPAEIEHGHRRSYDRVNFDRDFESGGAQILARGGLMLKPFGNAEMDSMIRQGIIGDHHLTGLEVLGTEYPDLCQALYVIAS